MPSIYQIITHIQCDTSGGSQGSVDIKTVVVKDRIMDLKDPLPFQFLDRIVDHKHISKEWKNDRHNCVSIQSSCLHRNVLKCSLPLPKSRPHAAVRG